MEIRPIRSKSEEEADRFAADTLIPLEDYELFVQNNCFYPHEIQRVAEQIGISPSIVVGWKQDDGLLNQS